MSSHDKHEDEGVAQLLPIFDPELPAEVRERLARRTGSLLPAEKKPSRTRGEEVRPRSAGGRAVSAVFLVALTAGATAAVAWAVSTFMDFFAVIATLLMLAGIVAAFRVRGWLGGIAAFFLFGGLITFGDWLGHDGIVILASVVTALLGILVTIGVLVADDSPRTHHDRYFIPDDFDEYGQTLLLHVQRTRRLIEESAAALGEAFDGQQASMIVQDQEWQLARLLYQQQKLSAELAEREENAVSATVRASLRPQREAIRAVHEAIERRVAAIVDYGEKVRLAVQRQREWEQIEEARSRDSAYGELIAEATAAQLGVDHLATAADLEAIREARDASIRDALAAGQWLAQAADVLSSPEQD